MKKFFESINSEGLKLFFDLHKDKIKAAALPLVIGLAVLFFWIYGSSGEDVTEMTDNPEVQSADEIDGAYLTDDNIIFVDISGAVNNPGVYETEAGTRLFRIIEMAGGFKEGYDSDSVNQAEEVYDGQKIIIPYEDQSTEGDPQPDSAGKGITNGKVNLNLAESAVLQTIPGIGPSKADRIIEYRQTQGKFRKIEDIMNITGIGEKTFESIKEYITV